MPTIIIIMLIVLTDEIGAPTRTPTRTNVRLAELI